MSEIEDILQKAQALGEALAGHARVRDYYAAQAAARADQDAQSALRDYQAQLQHVRQLEAAQKPIEVADKRRLAELESRMVGSEPLKRLMRAQADYVELMNRVNRTMEAPLAALGKGGEAQ